MTESGAPETYRLFLAISLPEDVESKLQEIQRILRKAVPGAQVRWTNREQLHLTMKFLGNVPAEKCPALLSAVSRTCGSFPQLRLSAGRVGFFPNAQRPRVIWVGVGDSGGLLSKLHQELEKSVASFSAEPPEERFQAHVTLARVKQMHQEEATKLALVGARSDADGLGCWTASHVDLIRSQLSPQGVSHSILGSGAFAANTHQ